MALMSPRIFALACVTALISTHALAQQESSAELEPRYVDANGEEIYGPEYRPESPTIRGAQLRVGVPNAGIRVPDDLKHQTQESFIPRFAPLSVPGETRELRREGRVPLRRSFTTEALAPRSLGERLREARSLPPARSGAVGIGAKSESVEKMHAHFVFVGQGDGAILEFPCGVVVIDTGGEFGGGERADGGELFLQYLETFFTERPHLDNTIDVVITTHPHADHLNGLDRLLDEENGAPLFKIRNVVDNGQTGATGSLGKQTRFRDKVVALGGRYSAVELARQVTATGATNNVIDPLNCQGVDPLITAFWGGINEALPEGEAITTSGYRNPNNHSVIVRIDFGAASFLFTGDLESRGETDLIEQYQDNLGVFDVDVYQVSHHGADEDTSDDFLEIMSPRLAVISMGQPEAKLSHTAWDHGHPRTGLLAVLQEEPSIVSDLRDPPRQFLAAEQQETEFMPTVIERAIYGTGWEGTVIISASTTGKYEIETLQH